MSQLYFSVCVTQYHHFDQVKMLQDSGICKTLCTEQDITGDEAKFINDRIREDYALNWLIDGLPAAEMKVDLRTKDIFYDMGFNLGNNEGTHRNLPALNNHYDIVLKYVILLFYHCNDISIVVDIMNLPRARFA